MALSGHAQSANECRLLGAFNRCLDLCPRSASIRAVEDCTAICISVTNLYQVYARDLKQFALIQMNMGREICRRLRESDNRLFSARMGMPKADSGHVFLAN